MGADSIVRVGSTGQSPVAIAAMDMMPRHARLRTQSVRREEFWTVAGDQRC
jgi:hypothetical protein